MNIEQIRAQAPKGATHINQDNNYFKVQDCIFMMWNPYDQKWFKTGIMRSDFLKPLH